MNFQFFHYSLFFQSRAFSVHLSVIYNLHMGIMLDTVLHFHFTYITKKKKEEEAILTNETESSTKK